MATPLDALGILAFVSAVAWWAVGLVAAVRSRLASPFDRVVAAASFLIGGWAFASVTPSDYLLAVRVSIVAVATVLILLATKWIARGHSRYDTMLALPILAALVLVWDGFASNANTNSWALFWALWAVQQVSYLAATVILWGSLERSRKDLPPSVGRRFFWTVGVPLIVLAVASVPPWAWAGSSGADLFSASLVIPAAIVLAAIVPISRDDWGTMLRAVSAIQERVTAIYMFYRTGEPLVALASNRNLPIEAEQLEAILSVVGNFVETSVPSSRGYAVTAMRYEGLGLVAVRGEFVIVAAVYDGPAYDALRSELTRTVKTFEERAWRELQSWEDATRVAEVAATELSNLLHRPERTPLRSMPRTRPTEAEPRKLS